MNIVLYLHNFFFIGPYGVEEGVEGEKPDDASYRILYGELDKRKTAKTRGEKDTGSSSKGEKTGYK